MGATVATTMTPTAAPVQTYAAPTYAAPTYAAQAYAAPTYAAPVQTYAAPVQTYPAPLQTYAAPAPVQYAAPVQTYAAPVQTYAAPVQTPTYTKEQYDAWRQGVTSHIQSAADAGSQFQPQAPAGVSPSIFNAVTQPTYAYAPTYLPTATSMI